jgi:hypothetical protein
MNFGDEPMFDLSVLKEAKALFGEIGQRQRLFPLIRLSTTGGSS